VCTPNFGVVKYSYIQSSVLTHYSFIPMYLPMRQRASEDRKERKHFDVGGISPGAEMTSACNLS